MDDTVLIEDLLDLDRVSDAHALGLEWCDMHRGYVDPDEIPVIIEYDGDGSVLLSICAPCEDGDGYTDSLDSDGRYGIMVMDELDLYEADGSEAWY